MAFHRGQHNGGIEQCEGIRHGADFDVGSVLEPRYQRNRSSEMTAGGFTSGHDAVGVDAETVGICTCPTYRRLRITQATSIGTFTCGQSSRPLLVSSVAQAYSLTSFRQKTQHSNSEALRASNGTHHCFY